MSGGVCPRCHQPYAWIERSKRAGRYYAFAIHKDPETKKLHKCYLGPVDGYVYVSRTHGDIGLRLKGLIDRGRALDYLKALLSYAEALEDPTVRLRLISLLQEALKILESEE